MDEDFDPDELHRLVDEALTPSRGPRPPVSSAGVLTFADLQILAAIDSILPQYLERADIAMITDQLRVKLLEAFRTVDVGNLHGTVKRCIRCSAATGKPTLPLGNNADPDVVFVVERLPVPFLEAFVETLAAAGHTSSRVVVTSVVRCPMADVTKVEVTNCSPYLYDEITAWKPMLIVPLGSTALHAVLSDPAASIKDERGFIHWLGPWAVLPSYAPGFVHNSPGHRADFEADLRLAYDFCYGGMEKSSVPRG